MTTTTTAIAIHSLGDVSTMDARMDERKEP
jgi:hypothetical protein